MIDGVIIDAQDRFPHRVIPKAICFECRRRVTVVLPSNTDLALIECACGSKNLLIGMTQ